MAFSREIRVRARLDRDGTTPAHPVVRCELRGVGFAATRWATLALVFGMAASCSKSRPGAAAQPNVRPPQPISAAAVPPPADGEHGAGKKGGGSSRRAPSTSTARPRASSATRSCRSSLKPFAAARDRRPDVARYYSLPRLLRAIGIDVAEDPRDPDLRLARSRRHHRRPTRSARSATAWLRLHPADAGQAPRALGAAARAAAPADGRRDHRTSRSTSTRPPPTMSHGECGSTARSSTRRSRTSATASPRARASTSTGRLDGWVRRKPLPEQAHRSGQRAGARQVLHGRVPRVRRRRLARREGDRLLRRRRRCSRGSTGRPGRRVQGGLRLRAAQPQSRAGQGTLPRRQELPGYFHPALRPHDAPGAPARPCCPGAARWIGRYPEWRRWRGKRRRKWRKQRCNAGGTGREWWVSPADDDQF